MYRIYSTNGELNDMVFSTREKAEAYANSYWTIAEQEENDVEIYDENEEE